MKILPRHILVSQVVSLSMTLLVFTFVLLLGNIFKDLMVLLADSSVSFFTIGRFFLMLLPYILSFSLPMALLSATLLVVGRVSADGELTACRACGLSFIQVISPILGVAAVLSMFSIYINSFVAPKMKYEFNRAFVSLILKNPISILEEGQFNRYSDGKIIYVGKRDMRHNSLKDIRIYFFDGSQLTQEVRAPRATITSDLRLLKMFVHLVDAQIDRRNAQEPTDAKKRVWGMKADSFPLELDLSGMVDPRKAVREIHHRDSWELWNQCLELKSKGIHPTPMLVEIHKRLALGTASLAFAMIAIPLSVKVQRRETSIGVLLSLILAILYYFLVLFAESFKKSPHMYPELLVWLPNLIFQTIGIYLIRKQNRQ